MSRLDELKARGFDRSLQAGRPGCESWIVRCSSCDAAVINSVPCHEPGCPRGVAAQRRAELNEANRRFYAQPFRRQ